MGNSTEDNFAHYGSGRVATAAINCLGFLPNLFAARMVHRATDTNHAAYALIVQNVAFNVASREGVNSV